MRIRTMAGFIALLFLIFFIPASAAMTSPPEARVGTTFTVSGLTPGANTQFILNEGVPVFYVADPAGTARYLPLNAGTLEIIVKKDGVVIDRATVTVLAATTTTPATGTGGGGGGGGGMATLEPNENIEKMDKNEKSFISNIPITYNFTVPGIYQIVITGTDNENLITIRVEALKAASKLVSIAPSGIVYKNLNVWAGTKRIKKALIKFRVENSWMQGNSLAGNDVKMLRWDGGKWVMIETQETAKDGTYTNFEATTDALSNFAITGLKGEVVPTVQAAGVTQTAVRPETTGQAATPKAAGFEIILAMAALCALYIHRRR